jgi:hypothetical protein
MTPKLERKMQEYLSESLQAMSEALGSVSKVEMAIFTLPAQRHSG